jgi:hypothetical protein
MKILFFMGFTFLWEMMINREMDGYRQIAGDG